MSNKSWKYIVRQKQDERSEAISKTRKRHPVDADAPTADSVYLNATASEIPGRIQAEQWTATAVVSAYVRQAIVAHGKTNCLTEVLFEQALREAAQLDAEFAQTKRLRGPFHGVPVSFKDQYEIAGYDASIGFTQWANKPSHSDAQLVKDFREAGAIIIAKTNVPQTMLSFECSNPLWGVTTNPYSQAHTCGGSSGGEAALLAMSGSALGIGSDIGGSLRIPSGYCGVYSIKPSPKRLSKVGAKSAGPGFEAIQTVMGPMARSVGDLELVCRTFFGGHTPDWEAIPPVPYRDVSLPAKLRFGYYTSDCFIKASPACKRAVLETVDALRREGHECVEFVPTLALEALYLFAALTSADGYKTLLSHLGPDPKESSLFLVTLGPRLPSFVRNLASWVAGNIIGDKIFATCMDHSRVKSVNEFYAFTNKREDLRKRWYEEVWNHFQFDGIIAPVQASPAIPHKASTMLSPLAAGTFLYNVIDSPVGVVPVTRVDPTKDALTDEWVNGPGLGSKMFEDKLYRDKNPTYDPKAMKGLPVGVQVVGRSWEDEKVIAMMHVVDTALGPRGFGPGAFKSINGEEG